MRFFRGIIYAGAILLAVGLLAFGYIRQETRRVASDYIYADVSSLPDSRVAMVLGAQVFPERVPSLALAYRLSSAVAAYREGKSTSLLMSGDGRSPYYNEVATMKDYAMALGVPESAMLLDNEGLRTYESCRRAKEVYKLEKLTVVSQEDHVARAVYLCRSLGIDANGLVAPEFITPNVRNSRYWRYLLREQGALVLAWATVHFSPNH